MTAIGIGMGIGQGGGGDVLLRYPLARDRFTDAQSPVIDGSAKPGAGKRDVTGSLLSIINGRLRGGGQSSSPAWGSSVYTLTQDNGTVFARAGGRTFCALFTVEDFGADFALGWLPTPTADPRTAGHCIVNEGGSCYISTPGQKITIDQGARFIRSMQYLFGVTLMPAGAVYWLATFAPDTGASDGMIDRVGVPSCATGARILWVEETDTTSLLTPTISYLDRGGSYPNGHAAEDARVRDVASWAAQDAFTAFVDHFGRTDSNTTPGNNWAAITGVWGLNGGALYNVSGSGFRTVYQPSIGNGDGIYRWKITLAGTATDAFRLTLRHSAAGDHIVLNSNGTTNALSLQKWAGGAFSSGIDNFTLPTALTAGSTQIFTLLAYGNRYKLYQNGLECNGGSWAVDAGNNYLTAGGIGVGFANSNPTVFRVDDVSVTPLIIAIPAEISAGAMPTPWTAGATLLSDTFTAADGTTLASLGYTAHSGTWTTQGNRASCVVGAGDNTATKDVGASDVEASIDVITPSSLSTGFALAALELRRVDTNNTILVRAYKDAGTSEIEIIERIAGSGAVVHKTDLSASGITTSGTYTLTVQCKGDQIRVLLGGKARLTYYTQAGSPLGTRCGVYRDGSDGGCVLDNLIVKALA